MDYFAETERNFEAAKRRLLAAQQEKMEAAAEFVAARTALSRTLETLWPERCECTPKFGYHKTTHGQYETRQHKTR